MNAEINLKRSAIGIDLIRHLAAQGTRLFSTAEARAAAPLVGLKDAYLVEALHHLRRSGWIVPVRRGLYALSGAIPGVAPVHEFEIAMSLVRPAAISHWSAMHHHGLTRQAPRVVCVLTTTASSVPRERGAVARRQGDGYKAAGVSFTFVQTAPERFFGTEQVWVGQARVTVTDKERTLVDGLSRPQHCGDFSEVLQALAARPADLDLDRLIDYAIRLDAATAKRLGWVLEHEGLATAQVDRLLAVPINGYRTLDPSGPRRGPCDRRWMVQVNLPGRIGM